MKSLIATKTEYGLRVCNLSKTYRAGQIVLQDINLDIVGDGITTIIGPSGAGKSTLIRCINRLVEPTSGDILFQGYNMAQLKGAELRLARRHIGMVFQEHNLVERLTVVENILTGRLGYISTLDAWLRRFPEQDLQEAYALIAAVGLAEQAHQRADRLSGGQRQRVGIARAIMQRPNLLLADEPTSALDPKTSVEIMELMSQLISERRIPVIVNMHNVALAQRFSKRIIGLAAGRIVFDGDPGQLQDADLKQIYGGEDWLV